MPTPSVRNPTPQPPSNERREKKSTPPQAPGASTSLLRRIAPSWAHFRFADIASAKHHSEDFVETRAEYIALRVRFMVLFFGITVPLWMPIDFLTLSAEHFPAMAIARCLLATTLLGIGLLTLRKLSPGLTHILLASSFVAPAAFYVVTMLILQQGAVEPAPAGYAFMPFVMVALLGLYPVTLACGALLEAIILVAFITVTALTGTLYTVDTFNKLWVFLMFGGTALWIQSGQLLMLLKLYRESTQDPLTGLINRRVLMKRLALEIERDNNEHRPFCILMFDLDRFKRINDNHGHLTGDMVLKTMADLLRQALREHDIVARFGGEEFVAVLPGLDRHEAIMAAERARQACCDARVFAPNGELIQLSTSVGVTQYESAEAVEAALNRADDCLYKAKVSGRNRVVHSQSGDAQPTALAQDHEPMSLETASSVH